MWLPLFVATLFCLAQILFSVIIAILDAWASKVDGRMSSEETSEADKVNLSDIRHLGVAFWWTTGSIVL